MDFFLCSHTGGEPVLGRDPEFDDDHQVLREVTFLSRAELSGLEVYPPYMKDELWKILSGDYTGYDAYKTRR